MQAGERRKSGTEFSLHDFLDRRSSLGETTGNPGFNPVNSGFRKPFRDPDLIVLREDDSGLLLSVTQSNVNET